MKIVEATREFEHWLSENISVVPKQLTDKHKQMAEDSIQFLRGTFYRGTQIFPDVCPDLAKSPKVLSRRRSSYRKLWYMARRVSSVLDARAGELRVSVKNVCGVVLDGYQKGLSEGGRAFVLEERHKWLREIALDHLDEPGPFWKKMDALPTLRTGIPAEARKALERMLPDPKPAYRVARRVSVRMRLGAHFQE